MMKRTIVLALFLLGSLMLMGGCGATLMGGGHQASGAVVSRTFDVADFDSISIGGSREIIFRQSDNVSVTVEQRESLFDILEVYARGGTLHVYFRGNTGVFNTGTQRVYVYAPSLEAANISGSARATGWDAISGDSFSLTASGSTNVTIPIDVNNLEINTSGSSTVTLSGRADTANISRSGSGSVNAFDVQIQDATVQSSGSSRVNVSVSDSLTATSSGSSRVRYQGNPSVTVSTSGSSSVRAD